MQTVFNGVAFILLGLGLYFSALLICAMIDYAVEHIRKSKIYENILDKFKRTIHRKV